MSKIRFLTRFRRSYITLLEVLIALSIVAIAAGVIAWNVRNFYIEQKTLDEMNQVAELVRRAQELLVITDLESDVVFKNESSGIRAFISPMGSTTPLMDSLLKTSDLLLTYITSISFEDAFQSTVLTDDFSLTFLSKGFLMNRGVLTMQSGKMVRSIILHGYPAEVELLPNKPIFPYSNRVLDEIQWITEETALQTAPAE